MHDKPPVFRLNLFRGRFFGFHLVLATRCGDQDEMELTVGRVYARLFHDNFTLLVQAAGVGDGTQAIVNITKFGNIIAPYGHILCTVLTNFLEFMSEFQKVHTFHP